MSRRNMIILALMLLASGIVPSTALAASSSASGYGGLGRSVQSSIDPAPGRSSTGGSELPFTGFDAFALAGAGVLLGGLGVTLRLLGRRTVRRSHELAPALEHRPDSARERELV
jgi:hypothetical protein